MNQRVLVVLDPGGNERLLPWLRRVLGGPPADLHLLSVHPPHNGVVVGQHRVAYAHQVEEAVRAETLVRLSPAATRLGDEGFRVATDVRFGDPVATVLRTAAELTANLIVLAVQERRGWRRWWTRSVDDEILRRATVPVLAVPRQALRAA
jgi:nucleotide-binding universal stress UspA family protein